MSLPGRTWIIAAFLLAASTTNLGAEGGWLYFRGDPAFEAEYWGSVRKGIVPSLAFPLFESELSGAGDSLGWAQATEGIQFSASTPSLWYDSPAKSILELSTPPVPKFPEIQLALGQVPSPLELDLGLVEGPFSARADISLTYRRDWLVGQSSTFQWTLRDWSTGLLGDIEFPRRSWVAYARPGFGLALGRFPSGIGAGHFGSTVLNPEALYYDQVRFHLGNEKLKLIWLLGSSSAQLSKAEAAVQWKYKADGSSYWDTRSDHDYSASQNAIKLFAYHLLEYRPIERLRLGITEMSIMGGTSPSLNFFLPTLLWHNTYAAGYANVGMAGLVSWIPIDGVLLSGQFFVDDTTAADETMADKPASYAWQAGASYTFSPASGALITLGLEYNHVDTWTYVRWQPYLTMYQRQMLPGGYQGIDVPLGFTYGPDVDQGGIWVDYRDGRGLRASISWELVFKGSIYMGMIDGAGIPVYYDYDLQTATTGALAAILDKPRETRSILRAAFSLPLGWGLSALGSASLAFYTNYGNVLGEKEAMAIVYAGIGWKPRASEGRP